MNERRVVAIVSSISFVRATTDDRTPGHRRSMNDDTNRRPPPGTAVPRITRLSGHVRKCRASWSLQIRSPSRRNDSSARKSAFCSAVRLAWPSRMGSAFRRQAEPRAQLAHRLIRPVGVHAQMIKIRGAPTTAERSGDPARREHEAGQQSAQIENPRYVIAPAPARELPGPDLSLADQARVVAGRHVMKIVLEQYRAPSACIREHERDWAQLDPDPVACVAAVFIESVIPQVAGSRLTQRRARG